jgi:hypothetical protein
VAASFDATVIDRAIGVERTRLGLTASAPVDDATYLRRAYIDIVGVIPPPEVVRSFLADAAPDKRAKMVQGLLAGPAYAESWAGYWDDLLLGPVREQAVDRGAFRAWLREQLAKNVPWNVLVRDLLTATGQNSAGGPRVPFTGAAMRAGLDDEGDAGADQPINGAVNWLLKYKDTPQDMAGMASRAFLGVQIQCAQCHDHKTEAWKQTDFQSFAACFVRTRNLPVDFGKVMGVRRFEVTDLGRPAPRFAKNPELSPVLQATPRTLDGADLSSSGNVRKAVAAWITAPNNPWFARAIVNRMWGHFLGRGFVDPVDDLRPSNPGVMPELLQAMADDFASHGYDLHRLIAMIAATEAYRLSSAPTDSEGGSAPVLSARAPGGQEIKAWSRFRLQPLGPEELLRSIYAATGAEDILRRFRPGAVDRVRTLLFRQYTFLFDVDEQTDAPDFEGTVAQALTLINGELVVAGTFALPGGALAGVLESPGGDPERVDALYLRTLSRHPTPEESDHWVRYVNETRGHDAPRAPRTPPAKKPGPGKGGGVPALQALEARDLARHDPKRQAYEDVFWALMNSSEFLFNH